MLPEDLIRMAISLEEQFRSLEKVSRKIPLEEWNSLTPTTKSLIPSWLQELLAGYRLAGPVFERLHENGRWHRYFRFWEPVTYGERSASDDSMVFEEVIAAGYIPLSDESDLDVWITPIAGDATSPVFLYDASGMEIREVSKNLTDFLASCKTSDWDGR
jgi:hypothetical protein